MVMKKDGRKRDIKSKLVAAVCMLLVSCIMMVSSTYAWFTLSTAPEVTGITTAVGANGNLEMALLPTTNGDTIKTLADALKAIGTSTNAEDTVVFKNTTWGNLVNLSAATYGLSNIALYPSRLNPEGITGGAFLEAPTYGADGRVNGFEDVLLNGIFDGTENFYEGGYGVRAVGSSTGMSARELAYRTALAAGDAAASAASTAASQSMNVGGSQLATIAMKQAMGTASFTQTDVQALLDVFTALNATNGPLDSIDTAFRQYAVAMYLGGLTDGSDYSTVVNTITNKESSLTNIATHLGLDASNTVLTDLESMKTEVAGAITDLTALKSATTITWDDIDDYVHILGTSSEMSLNDKPMSHWTAKEGENFKNISELVQLATSPAGLTIVVSDGIYHDIAQYTGNLVGNVKMENLEYNGLVATVNATMKANCAQTAGAHLVVTKAAVAFTASENDTDAPISTFYGYIIDLGFRTNAADSYLQLQTNGIDRIYENGTNSNTQGGGSTMSFNVVEGFNQTKVANLMSCIRVVFFNPETLEVYQQARLDVDTLVATETKYTMDLKLWDTTTSDFKVNSDSTPNVDESTAITALIQNEAKAVSVLVYLDGENLTNGDVATSDLAGTMNLQFSSSATLNPMEYGDLMSDGAESYAVTVPEGVTGETKATANTAYTFTVATGYTLGTVTVGGTAVTPTDNGNGSYTIPADKVTGAIVINVTANN